jgi:hypothetical protein
LLKRLEKTIAIKKDKNLIEKIKEKQSWMRKEINPETYIINYENWMDTLFK